MLPLIVTTLCLLLIKSREDSPIQVAPKPLKAKPPVFVPLDASATTMFKHNLIKPITTDEYQSLLKPSLFDAPPLTVQDLFLRSLQQPHIRQVGRFEPLSRIEGDVQAYRQRFAEQMWQIAAISTVYGFIYLSLMLGEDSRPVGSVLISYDMGEVANHIYITSLQQIERFGYMVFQYDQVAHSEALLQFFLGDGDHPYSIHRYLLKGE